MSRGTGRVVKADITNGLVNFTCPPPSWLEGGRVGGEEGLQTRLLTSRLGTMVGRHTAVTESKALAMVREAHLDTMTMIILRPQICESLPHLLHPERDKGTQLPDCWVH